MIRLLPALAVYACAGPVLHHTHPVGTEPVPLPQATVRAPPGPEAFSQAMAGFDYSQALVIAEAWAKQQPNDAYAGLASARAACALADMAKNEGESEQYAQRAQQVLAAMKGKLPAASSPAILGSSPEGVWEFHSAEAIALQARWKGTGALPLLSQIAEHGERAVKLAPTYDDAAPLRLLGMLLIKAPAWPNGPGDQERGQQLLEQALRAAPQRAEGHIHHADALLDQSRVQEAQRELKRGRELAGKNPRAIKLANEVEQRVKTNKGVKSY